MAKTYDDLKVGDTIERLVHIAEPWDWNDGKAEVTTKPAWLPLTVTYIDYITCYARDTDGKQWIFMRTHFVQRPEDAIVRIP